MVSSSPISKTTSVEVGVGVPVLVGEGVGVRVGVLGVGLAFIATFAPDVAEWRTEGNPTMSSMVLHPVTNAMETKINMASDLWLIKPKHPSKKPQFNVVDNNYILSGNSGAMIFKS